MSKIVDSIIDVADAFIAWVGSGLGQFAESYCNLETADSRHCLVGRDGSLVSIIKINGITELVGVDEFNRTHQGLSRALQVGLARPGRTVQVYFQHNRENVAEEIDFILGPAKETAKRLNLKLEDLFSERIENLSNYCGSEGLYITVWTLPSSITDEQLKQSAKRRSEKIKKSSLKIDGLPNAQNFLATIPELRDSHDSYIKNFLAEIKDLKLSATLLDIHDACREIRMSLDPDFTDRKWMATLPGDKFQYRETNRFNGEISDVFWPPLASQLMPRDARNIDMRTAKIGDRIYATVFIDLFPKELQEFANLFSRVLSSNIPWRISFLFEGGGERILGLKRTIASVLSFASSENKLISDSAKLLGYIKVNTDDAIVKLRVSAGTWAREGEDDLLKTRLSELAKAIQGWGYCETSEICGDPFAGVISNTLGFSKNNPGTASVAPLSDVTYMLPFTRPASLWQYGAVLFRTPDGKPWPYQPGSSLQTTWIDLVYARPGSGKSVLSNTMNLALCLSAGLVRLPRISIIDIGPSSSGLISLLKEALPEDQRHLVAYHRMQMSEHMSINPFDTQLGARYPTAQERAFLVNFLCLLATPVGENSPYDGIADMSGLIVDELYARLADDASPNLYTANIEPKIDDIVNNYYKELPKDPTWWEVTDCLFNNGYIYEAHLAQRYAIPLLADAASICRTQVIADLYGKITTPTGEPVINAFARMISSAIREYPILSRPTAFDIGDARVVSLDLDEVAKSGGDAANRQTSVMYMLARYVLARHYYLTEDSVNTFKPEYQEYHLKRVSEIREDPKRIVYDEFHRTANSHAVRDQVIVDMREGRKWNVQVSLLSQSLDDFDKVMVEFATSIFIMDAGPKQAVERSVEVFGLSDTARLALETKVHGPRAGGATFLAIFATKQGINTQLITSTIGPHELWAFNTTAIDTRIRNALYNRIGADEARKILSIMYPTGSATKVIEDRLNSEKKKLGGVIDKEKSWSIVDQMIEEIISTYNSNMMI